MIAAAVIAVILALGIWTGLLKVIELKTNDANFRIKLAQTSKTIKEGAVYSERNPRISDDIMIVGIDFNSLTKYGRWPFPRSRHATSSTPSPGSRTRASGRARSSSISFSAIHYRRPGPGCAALRRR